MQLNLGLISSYRTELMGISAILVLVVHANGNDVLLPDCIQSIFNYGQLGVDMFLFLSGLGMYYSLSGFKICNLFIWYKRRFIRLLLPYVVIALPIYLFDYWINNESICEILLRFSTISFWTKHNASWFVALLIPLYLLTPFLSILIESTQKYRGGVIALLILAIEVFLYSPILGNNDYNTIGGNIRFVSYHLPAFFVGYWAAPYIKMKKHINPALIIVLPTFLFVFLYILGIPKQPILLYPLMGGFCFILPFIEKCAPKLLKSISFMGRISLESYLTNTMLPSVISFVGITYFSEYQRLNYGNYLYYVMILVIGIWLAYLVNNFCDHIKNKING